MDPVTLTAISIAASAAGAGVSAKGASDAGKAGAAQYNYQSAVALKNKEVALQNADFARARGEVEAQQSGMKSRYQLGKIRAGQGASGLDVNRGSAVEVRASQADIAGQDQDLIRNDAARKAYGYEVEARNQTAQSALYGSAATQSKRAGNIGVASSILGGVSSVAGKWTQASSTGIFGASTNDNPRNVGSAISWDGD